MENLKALAEAFHRDGFVIVPGLFSPDEVETIKATFMAQNAEGPVEGLSEIRRGGKDGYSDNDPLAFYPRMMHPHKHADKPVGPLSMRYMLDPRVQEFLRLLMKEEPVAAQSMFYFKPAGARGQDLHQDNYYLRVAPDTCYAAWTALDDVDQENGGMVAVPGSHTLPVLCPTPADKTLFFTDQHVDIPEGMAAIPVDMKAGDVFFFNGSVIHGSYTNSSKDRFRRAFICHYVPKASAELSHFYHCLDFEGNTVGFGESTMGGPCGGTWMEVKGPH
ncbi:phytanoyl-CoA dioxygenase family protein [Armatimonas sp.]|uniref:phytanoyl-CoA dioxygenase family protein n=1 Tax=Armatimonas sp. TaxID=1872638 RepID=UPI00286D31B2|nr:phytanoyl-CoA dioxygenase family protein [Armatimonas sp.]